MSTTSLGATALRAKVGIKEYRRRSTVAKGITRHIK